MLSPIRPLVRHNQSCAHQIRHASLLRRPKRPYTFTQLITLSDGSTFLHRTTSPQPVYRSARDTKNNALWNPSSQKLLNVEEDEAGRLRRFRRRFGRGFDAEATAEEGEQDAQAGEKSEDVDEGMDDASLLDMISGFSVQDAKKSKAASAADVKQRGGKGKSGDK